jgi:predicted ferric reductase
MAAGLVRIILYACVASLAAALAFALGDPGQNAAYEVGRSFALIGFMILVLQFVLASRIKWIERTFGLDIVIRFHRHIAVFAGTLLLLHPVLLAAGGQGWPLLLGLDLPWYILAGKAALAVLLVHILLSRFQGAIRLPFERWRLTHDILAPLALVLAFAHSWFAGGDLQLLSLRILWPLSLIAALAAFAFHRLLRPHLLGRRPYRVIEVRSEAPKVWTLSLAPPEGESIPAFHPGQFHFLTLHRGRGLPEEEHHWTISSSPYGQGTVSSTIKAVGDFTETVKETRPGDTATVHGPFGRFSYALHPEDRDLVFLAGGIGITPLMSMIRHMRDIRDDRSVLLLYANRREEQIVFRNELDEIQAGGYPNLRVEHVLSRPSSSWTGETGHLDRSKLEKHCTGGTAGRAFYVCGPPGMVRALLGSLRSMGVPDSRIRLEIFSFLD